MPGSIDPMTAVVQRVKAFAYYCLGGPDILAPGLQLSALKGIIAAFCSANLVCDENNNMFLSVILPTLIFLPY